MTLSSIEARLCLAATLALTAGALIYAYARGEHVAAVTLALCVGSLPTLLHTAAFALLSLAVAAPWARLTPAICAAWFVIESAFEALQLPIVAHVTHMSALAPDSSLIRAYLRGTFDPMDILAAAAGALLAAWIGACATTRDAQRCNR